MIFSPCHKLLHFLRPPPPWSVTYFMDGSHSGEVRKKSKVEIFFIQEKVWKFDVEGNIYYRGVI